MNDQRTDAAAAQAKPKPSAFSKGDARYWKSRIFKRTTDDWQAQISFGGRRERFPLGTANKDAAAAKAREIWLSLQRDGWEATTVAFKPWTVKPEKASGSPTVGEFLQQVKAVSDLKPVTFEIYARKFRRLVAGVSKIEGGKRRFDYVNKGNLEWRAQVDGVRLADLTPEKIQTWKVESLKKASANPLQHKHALSTVASVIRAGKALFAQGVTRHLSLRLPSPLPFEGIKAGNTGNHRYKSEVNAGLLLQQATRELQPSQPDVFKIVLLALGAGLRRDEIDTLTWKQIDWRNNTIRVETNVHTSAKSLDSENEVDVDPILLGYLREFFKTSQSEFVVDSAVATRPGTTSYHHYRCNRLFKKAVVWLRAKGVGARNPLHSLRKEFGSLICAQAGLFAASSALRHSNIALTRDYYVDKKHPIRLAIGELLKASQTTGTEDSAATPQSAEPAA